MPEHFFKRSTCCLCGSKNLELVVPLVPLPCGSPTVGTEGAEVRQNLVPLDVYFCNDCEHVQLLDIIEPEFQYTEYRWTTSISVGLAKHFESLADHVTKRLGIGEGAQVLEIGSNDGTVLKLLKARGLKVQGVDPARNIAEKATSEGVPTRADFFTSKLAKDLEGEIGKADIVLANYVFANLFELDDMVEGIKLILKDDGVFTFETQYGLDVFERTLLDTIYHEHISYFNIRPLRKFFDRLGMEVFDVQRIETKGGSIRVSVQKKGGGRPVQPIVEELDAYEVENGFNTAAVYKSFSDTCQAVRDELLAKVDEFAGAGGKVAGYGASVGTITLMHYFGLQDRLDCIFDDAPMHDMLYGPGYAIPVLTSEQVYTRKPDCIVGFAWRYMDPITKRHQKYLDEGGVFLVTLPEVSVIRKAA